MNVGSGQIDITPDFTVELSGYASRVQPSTGVLEPIFARAIFLAGGDEKLLWINCDVVAFERDFVVGVREWGNRELGLKPHQVLLSATHTHTGPGTIHLIAAGEYSERYVQLLRTRVEEVARFATAQTQPCALWCAQTELNLAIDRRGKPTAHIDPIVSALGFARSDGEFVAAIVNYTMHPVAHGHGERRISPDWPGPAAGRIAKTLPGGPTTIVCNGAAGNINPPAPDQPWEKVCEYGYAVGDAAIRALTSAQPQADPNLAIRSIEVPVPLDWMDESAIDRLVDEKIAAIAPDYVWAVQIKRALEDWRIHMKQQVAAGGGREVPIELQIIHLGDTFIVAVNGEMFTRFTAGLREMTGAKLFTVAYANSAFGYIPTREAYAEGGYEVETAHYFYRSFRPLPGGLELLRDRAAEILKSMM